MRTNYFIGIARPSEITDLHKLEEENQQLLGSRCRDNWAFVHWLYSKIEYTGPEYLLQMLVENANFINCWNESV